MAWWMFGLEVVYSNDKLQAYEWKMDGHALYLAFLRQSTTCVNCAETEDKVYYKAHKGSGKCSGYGRQCHNPSEKEVLDYTTRDISSLDLIGLGYQSVRL